MILERWMNPSWLSNSYLVADRPGGEAFIVDTGAAAAPVIEAVAERGLSVRWIFNTHHHHDHTAANGELRSALGARIAAHELDAHGIEGVDRLVADGETIGVGGLSVRILHIPGHTAGQIALLVEGAGAPPPAAGSRGEGADRGENPAHLFTGDTLFRGSVGGTRAPGHTTFADLRRSILERLLTLPPATVVHPGHTVPTTVGEELEENPFVRVMRGLAPEGRGWCSVSGQRARLIVHARDYDDGTKAWVRFEEGGRTEDAVVPGSRVTVE